MNNQGSTFQLEALLNDLGERGMSEEGLEQVRAVVQTQKVQPSAISQETIALYENWLGFLTQQRSFQFQEVLKTVVQSEQQRIKNESMAWRVGAGLVGLMFGMGDGFQMTDMFQAMAMGTAAGFAHGVFSEEDRKFLRQIEFDWVLDNASPAIIDQRLGRATWRLAIPTENDVVAFSVRRGIRGEYLLPINLASATCPAFTNENSKQVLGRTFDGEDMEILANQLYPSNDEPTKLGSMRKIRWEEAEAEVAPINEIARSLNYEPVIVEVNNESIFGYRVDIPTHSDY